MTTDATISGARTLHRLLYCSRQNEAVAARLEQEVSTIIATSAVNNGRVGVTGLLLTYRGWFLQALEGEHRAVMTTYGRVLNDPRHYDCKVIASGPAETRAFAAWKMCARQLSPADAAILEILERREPVDPPALTPAAALKLLSTVAGVQARAAA